MSISRPGWVRRHLVREGDQLVGLLAHRAHDDDDVVALAMGAGDVIGDGPDAVGVGDRGAAVLLHEEGHGVGRYQCRLWGDPGKPVGSPRSWAPQNVNARRLVVRPVSRAQEAEQSAAKRKRTVIRGAILLVAFIAVAFGISRLVGKDDNNDSVSSGTTVAPAPHDRNRYDCSRQHRHHGGRCEHVRGVDRFDRHDDRRKGHHRRHALPADRRLG